MCVLIHCPMKGSSRPSSGVLIHFHMSGSFRPSSDTHFNIAGHDRSRADWYQDAQRGVYII
jgi:hypothetical protein